MRWRRRERDAAPVDQPSAVLEARAADVIVAVTAQDAALFESLELISVGQLREERGWRHELRRGMPVLGPGLRGYALGTGGLDLRIVGEIGRESQRGLADRLAVGARGVQIDSHDRGLLHYRNEEVDDLLLKHQRLSPRVGRRVRNRRDRISELNERLRRDVADFCYQAHRSKFQSTAGDISDRQALACIDPAVL